MKVLLVLMLVGAAVGAVWFFGFRKGSSGTGAMAPPPQKIAPPTTAGGIVDQTISTVQQGISIFNAGQDLWDRYAN